jgi:hypothetical protein
LKGREGLAMGRRFLSSGKTRGEFAAAEGVTVPMVQYWAGKVRRADWSSGTAIEKASPAFVEIVERGRVGLIVGGNVTLEMHGARLRFDATPPASYVAELAVELARRAGC